MTVIESVHDDYGATFETHAGRRIVSYYERPHRRHRAVRNVAGVIEHSFGVITVAGGEREAIVDAVFSNDVPETDETGVYAFVLDGNGTIVADAYVLYGGERFLLLVPPGREQLVAERLQAETYADSSVSVATDEFAVFGVHGPKATEKVASVLHQVGAPDPPLSFVRGSTGDVGVTVVRDDDLVGEEGYFVICAAADAARVFDTLVNRGLNATPIGHLVWDLLTLEAGTPLFDAELRGSHYATVGVRNAFPEAADLQSAFADADRKLRGIVAADVPSPGADLLADDDPVGTVVRAAESPVRDEPVAFAFVDGDVQRRDLLIERPDGSIDATIVDLPFIEGTATSARLPRF